MRAIDPEQSLRLRRSTGIPALPTVTTFCTGPAFSLGLTRHSKPELRWFWSITVYLNPKRGITTSGRASSLEEAKAQFLANWQKCCTDSTAAAQRPT